MSHSGIDGMGNRHPTLEKKNLSKRAIEGKLYVKRQRCPHCNHHKIFMGNTAGLNIKKCCKCKKRV